MMSPKGNSNYVQAASRIELQQMRYFCAVAEHLNFSRAADELYVSQSLLSQQISALESELGTKLFSRSTKSVSLTPNGAVFLTEVRRILNRVDEAICAATNAARQGEDPTQIQILCDELFDRSAMAKGALRLMSRYPNIMCFVHVTPYFTMEDQLDNRQGDICITFAPSDSKLMSDRMSSAILGEDWLDILLPSNTDISQINSLPLLLPERDTRLLKLAKRLCSAMDISSRVIFHVYWEDIIIAVELDSGFTVLPHRIAQQYQNRAVQIISLEKTTELSLNYLACWSRENLLEPERFVPFFEM